MPDTVTDATVPAPFATALDELASAQFRPELVVTTIASPTTVAPFSRALAADLSPARHDADSDSATGRFILLYDPQVPDAWRAPFRIVTYAQAPLETDIGVDPFLADVAWSWLTDALAARGAGYSAASGTATKILSTGFGELAEQGDGAQIELRASWTPDGANFNTHAEAWGDLLCMLAGLPPNTDGVSVLAARRKQA